MDVGRWAKPTIIGETVILRPIDADDAAAMWAAVNDPESNDLTQTTEQFRFEQIAQWCASRAAASERLDLAVIDRASGLYAGEVVLNEFDPSANTANFRIALAGPQWFGRGLGTHAARLIVRHGFEVIGLAVVTLTVLRRNERAIRSYRSVGFVEVEEYVDDGEQWVRMHLANPSRAR